MDWDKVWDRGLYVLVGVVTGVALILLIELATEDDKFWTLEEFTTMQRLDRLETKVFGNPME